MNYKKQTIALLFFFLAPINVQASAIKNIFIDINAIIKPSPTAASHIIGIINSMRYTATVGNIPSRSDFFKALKNIPACSTQQTYNEDMLMPSILCDWLLGLKPNKVIRATIFHSLDTSSMSEIEKTIFKNITSMMMTPSIFIDTQYVLKDLTRIIHKLKKNGYNVYLIGNWDKESEGTMLRLLQNSFLPDIKACYFSHTAQALKPNREYFDALLEEYSLMKNECLVIDIEKSHAQSALSQGFPTILSQSSNSAQLKTELVRAGIRI